MHCVHLPLVFPRSGHCTESPAVERELLKATNRDLLVSRAEPAALLDALEAQVPIREPKWIGDEAI